MKNIIYFFQFIFISLFFLIFKFLRLKLSSAIGGKLFQLVGPIFRSNKLIRENIKKALPQLNNEEIKKINKQMWNNYGRIFSEYMFLICSLQIYFFLILSIMVFRNLLFKGL